jgi:hypothetical protein
MDPGAGPRKRVPGACGIPARRWPDPPRRPWAGSMRGAAPEAPGPRVPWAVPGRLRPGDTSGLRGRAARRPPCGQRSAGPPARRSRSCCSWDGFPYAVRLLPEPLSVGSRRCPNCFRPAQGAARTAFSAAQGTARSVRIGARVFLNRFRIGSRRGRKARRAAVLDPAVPGRVPVCCKVDV